MCLTLDRLLSQLSMNLNRKMTPTIIEMEIESISFNLVEHHFQTIFMMGWKETNFPTSLRVKPEEIESTTKSRSDIWGRVGPKESGGFALDSTSIFDPTTTPS